MSPLVQAVVTMLESTPAPATAPSLAQELGLDDAPWLALLPSPRVTP